MATKENGQPVSSEANHASTSVSWRRPRQSVRTAHVSYSPGVRSRTATMRRFAGKNASVFARRRNCSGKTVVSGAIGTSALRRAMASAGWHGHESDANRLRCSVPSRLPFARPRSERRQPSPRLARHVEQGAPDEDGSAQRDVPSNHRHRAGLVGEHHGQYVSCIVRFRNALRKAGCFTDDSIRRTLARCAARSTCGKDTVLCCHYDLGTCNDPMPGDTVAAGTCSNDPTVACDTSADCTKSTARIAHDAGACTVDGGVVVVGGGSVCAPCPPPPTTTPTTSTTT